MDGARRGEPGGRQRLREFLREHGEAVEQDLADRGIDLRDVFRPGGGDSRLTWRRLAVLIRGFPAHSRTATSQNGGVPVLSLSEALLYHLADAANLATWQRGAYLPRSKTAPKPPAPPQPLPRPGDEVARGRVRDALDVSDDDLRAFRERRRLAQGVSDAG